MICGIQIWITHDTLNVEHDKLQQESHIKYTNLTWSKTITDIVIEL